MRPCAFHGAPAKVLRTGNTYGERLDIAFRLRRERAAPQKGPVVTPKDKDYQQTKRIKQTASPLQSPFREVAEWVAANYGVHVLNVVYDAFAVARRTRPRLTVVLETKEDAAKFKDGMNFRTLDQQRVREQFAAILSMMREPSLSAEGLFVPFVAFEPVAIIEAMQSVTKDRIEQLKNKLANEDLWEISRMFDRVTFLFFKNAQVARYANLREAYSQEYLQLVEPYDEFGYVKKRGLTVRFDSKEIFDTKFNSNWFYYYR
jgi:hypothetical protein